MSKEWPELTPTVGSNIYPDDNRQEAEILRETQKIMKNYAGRKDLNIKMKGLKDKYSEQEIQKDINWTIAEILKEQKRNLNSHASKMMENMVTDLGDKWFGENVRVVLLSPYDDRKAHGDVVMEIKTNGEIIRILIDLTTATNRNETNEKMSRNELEIKNNELASLKYFISKFDGTRGQLNFLPRVIAGVQSIKLLDACKLMAKGDVAAGKSVIPALILDEMRLQLIYLKRLAKNKSIESVFTKALSLVEELFAEKKKPFCARLRVKG